MADFTFCRGDVRTIDHTPAAGDVAEGSMVLLGNTAGLCNAIAMRPIVNGVLGALAVGGSWKAAVAGNYAAGTKVWKPVANAILSTTSTNASLFGFTAEAAAAANAVVEVLHHPFV